MAFKSPTEINQNVLKFYMLHYKLVFQNDTKLHLTNENISITNLCKNDLLIWVGATPTMLHCLKQNKNRIEL